MVPEIAALVNHILPQTYVNVKQCWSISFLYVHKESSKACPSSPAKVAANAAVHPLKKVIEAAWYVNPKARFSLFTRGNRTSK